jgi:5-formyltetrahydrofolate cyclo-ligase
MIHSTSQNSWLPECNGWEAVRKWRRRTRDELLKSRLAVPRALRRRRGDEAKRLLMAAVDLAAFPILGIYWPIRGEIDVRDLARKHLAAGGRLALPVITLKDAPVEFWRWVPGTPMLAGAWNIPIPREREVLEPDALIVPLVGFDRSCFRLGYGSGFYDRTLAAAAPQPFTVGLGYADAELTTIYPQSFDIAMNMIVTDRFVRRQPEAA